MGGRVLVSGCSGGGKSSLLAELSRRGHRVVPEPGRRIVEGELARNGHALPWTDPAAFARRALAMARDDLARVQADGWTFFDRGIVDAACALQHATGEPAFASLTLADRYDSPVFLTPPWPDIYVADAARRHGLEDAVAEYRRLEQAFAALDYETVVLPRATVEERAGLVLATLGL